VSDQTQQAPGWGPPTTPPPPTPPKRKRQFLVTKIAVGVAAGIALFIVGGIVLLAVTLSGGSSTSGKQATIATPAATASNSPAATPVTAPPAVAPKPSDFQLTVKTLSKECFGEAGCNITFRIEVGYDGPTLDPDTTWEVTYEIRGAEDPQINTLTVTGDQSSVDQKEIASTKSASAHLKAVVTDVSEL
jgi:hypothetical protein